MFQDLVTRSRLLGIMPHPKVAANGTQLIVLVGPDGFRRIVASEFEWNSVINNIEQASTRNPFFDRAKMAEDEAKQNAVVEELARSAARSEERMYQDRA